MHAEPRFSLDLFCTTSSRTSVKENGLSVCVGVCVFSIYFFVCGDAFAPPRVGWLAGQALDIPQDPGGFYCKCVVLGDKH